MRATTWWFADNEDRPEELEKIAESFQRLRAILEPDLRSDPGRDTWARVLADFVDDADPGARDYLALRLAECFAHFGREDLADRVRVLSRDFAGSRACPGGVMPSDDQPRPPGRTRGATPFP